MATLQTKLYRTSSGASKIDLVRGWVKRIDVTKKTLELDGGAPIAWTLVIATGSKTAKYGWPGQDLTGVQGLADLRISSCSSGTAPA
jgi:NADH dehydrogenase FAD-containing subunit